MRPAEVSADFASSRQESDPHGVIAPLYGRSCVLGISHRAAMPAE